jgi:YgiT-type zinc finger domain-containing protein
MKCSIKGCPGEYEERKIVHTVKNSGRVIVIDHVPADVCTICGDTLLSPNTVKHIEHILEETKSPEKTVPLYEYV